MFGNFVVNILMGLLLGFIIVILTWAHNTTHYLNYIHLDEAMDKNKTIKELYYEKYPEKYKLRYTDWKEMEEENKQNEH